MTADVYAQEAVRDAFITELSSSPIRQRLLEKQTLILDEVVTQARSLEMAQLNTEMYSSSYDSSNYPPVTGAVDAAPSGPSSVISSPDSSTNDPAVASTQLSCQFCGRPFHPQYRCPAWLP